MNLPRCFVFFLDDLTGGGRLQRRRIKVKGKSLRTPVGRRLERERKKERESLLYLPAHPLVPTWTPFPGHLICFILSAGEDDNDRASLTIRRALADRTTEIHRFPERKRWYSNLKLFLSKIAERRKKEPELARHLLLSSSASLFSTSMTYQLFNFNHSTGLSSFSLFTLSLVPDIFLKARPFKPGVIFLSSSLLHPGFRAPTSNPPTSLSLFLSLKTTLRGI